MQGFRLLAVPLKRDLEQSDATYHAGPISKPSRLLRVWRIDYDSPITVLYHSCQISAIRLMQPYLKPDYKLQILQRVLLHSTKHYISPNAGI